MMYVWLILGFVLLIKGADLFVDGSSSVARIFKVPAVIIGLTIVAMGTSAPETAVSISAAVRGQNEIALSNVIGSNLFNLLVVVGICAAIKPVIPAKEIIRRDLPISLLCAVLLLVASLNLALGNAIGSNIFNILLVMGLSTVISPIGVNMQSVWDLVVLIAMSAVILVYLLIRKKLDRPFGLLMVLTYIGYMAYIIQR